MDRPQAHVTDSQGEAQMRAIFEPIGWAVNRIEKDYGIDFDVQMFEHDKATGEWFKVQLKSSESSQYSATGNFVSETLSKDHASHYSTEIRDPIFIIHADVKAKRTFWFAPHPLQGIDVADRHRKLNSMNLRRETVDPQPFARWHAVVDKHDIERTTVTIQTEPFLGIRSYTNRVPLIFQTSSQEVRQRFVAFDQQG